VSPWEKSQRILGFRPLHGQGRYLGLPFLFSKSHANDFQSIVDKVQAKLAGWKLRCLSWASRDVLAKAVGMAVQAYALMSFPIPMTRSKWGWRVWAEESSLWLEIVKVKYLRGDEFRLVQPKRGDLLVWKAILKWRDILSLGACLQPKRGLISIYGMILGFPHFQDLGVGL
ncbi:hypothetical protein PanWU01x14_013030, partial [Parasponia andersonii]